MVTLEREWKPSTKLNVIGGALDFTSVEVLPKDISRDQIEEYCYTLRQLYGEYVDELVAETTLSRREAQTWVLRNLVHEGSERLSYEAIGLYIWAIGRATEGDPLSRTIVSEYNQRAEEKIQQAEATVKRTGPPPYPDDLYDDPAVVWVEGRVGERLMRRCAPDQTYSEYLTSLLDATAELVSLDRLLTACRDAEIEHVAVDTHASDWFETLTVRVRGDPSSLSAVVREADVLKIDTERYPLALEIDQDLTPARSDLVIYDATEGPDPAMGRDRLKRALDTAELSLVELVDRLKTADARALFVGDDPTAAGAHLYPLFSEVPEETPLARLEALVLDDRTLTVGAVTPRPDAPDALVDIAATAVWIAEDAVVGEALELPADPVKRRERLPAAVLRTA